MDDQRGDENHGDRGASICAFSSTLVVVYVNRRLHLHLFTHVFHFSHHILAF